MKNGSSRLYFGLLVIFLATIYSILLFSLKKAFSVSSWIAYGFTMLAFLILILDTCIPNHKSKRYPIFGIPISAAAMSYFCAQFLLGGILAMIFNDLNPTVTIIAATLLLALYIVAAFIILIAKDIVETQDEYDKDKVAFIRFMKIDLDNIASEVQDDSLRSSITVLAEAIRYSDPISSAALADVEERIKSNIGMLREEAEEHEYDKAGKRTEKIRRLLDERNAKCAAMK